MELQEVPPEAFTGSLAIFEKSLGWPTGTLVCLAEETDWSFIIRGLAMVEAALSSMVGRHDPRLSPIFDNLTIGHSKTGKIAVAGALQLITTDQRDFITQLNVLRNQCVHDIGHFNFSIAEWVASLDYKERERFFSALEWGADANELEEWRKAFRERPKLGLLSGILRLIVRAQLYHEMKSELKLDEKMIAIVEGALGTVMHAAAKSRWPA